MKTHKTCIKDALLFEVERYNDERGYFMETWNHQEFGLPNFVQDNQARSKKGVLRGLHYQNELHQLDTQVHKPRNLYTRPDV